MTTSEFLVGAFDGDPFWRKFCAEFETMRDVWVSDRCPVGLMLWALGQNLRNKHVVLIEYAQKFCKANITGYELCHVDLWWPVANNAFKAVAEAEEQKSMEDPNESLLQVLEVHQAHRNELRRLFPGPFIFGIDGFHPETTTPTRRP